MLLCLPIQIDFSVSIGCLSSYKSTSLSCVVAVEMDEYHLHSFLQAHLNPINFTVFVLISMLMSFLSNMV